MLKNDFDVRTEPLHLVPAPDMLNISTVIYNMRKTHNFIIKCAWGKKRFNA